MADINFIPQNPILMITTISKGRKADRAARREDTMVARSAAILPVTSLILHSIMTCEAPEIKAIIEIVKLIIEIINRNYNGTYRDRDAYYNNYGSKTKSMSQYIAQQDRNVKYGGRGETMPTAGSQSASSSMLYSS